MHTEVRVRTLWKKMEKLADVIDDKITYKSAKCITDVPESEYNREDKYTYDVYIRHNEGVDPKKELQRILDTL